MGVEPSLSCGDDFGVANELDEEEALDKPGTTIGTVLRRKTNLLTISNETWLLTIGPQEYPWSSPTFPSDNAADVSSMITTIKNMSNSLT